MIGNGKANFLSEQMKGTAVILFRSSVTFCFKVLPENCFEYVRFQKRIDNFKKEILVLFAVDNVQPGPWMIGPKNGRLVKIFKSKIFWRQMGNGIFGKIIQGNF